MFALLAPLDSDWVMAPGTPTSGQVEAHIKNFPQGADGWEWGATTLPGDPKSPINSKGIFPALGPQSVFGDPGDTMQGVIRWTFLQNPVSDWSPVKSVVIV